MKDAKHLPGSHREPVKTFQGHDSNIVSIATFPDGKRIATGSYDNTIRIWSLEDGKEMMKWVVKQMLGAFVVLGNGKQVVSAEGEDPRSDPKKGFQEDDFDNVAYWGLWVRDVESGRIVAGPLEGHTNAVFTLDISPDGKMLASGSFDRTVILWDTTTWQRKGHPLACGSPIYCVRFSPTGQLGVATMEDIQIWDLKRRKRLAQFNGHRDFHNAANTSLTWTHGGTHLFSAGSGNDPVIRCWVPSTSKQAGDPWTGHDENKHIFHIVLNPAGTLLASASDDHTVRLWQFPTGTEVARFEHSHQVFRVAFSVDGRSIFSGGHDMKISQWEIPRDVLAAVESVSLASAKNKSETQPNSLSSYLDADATGGDGMNDNPYNNFFQSSNQSLPSASPGSHLPHLFSARRFFKVFSRPHPPADESVPKERSKRKFFARRARSNASLELATMAGNPPAQEGKVGEGSGEQGDNDCGSANDPPSARNNESGQRDETPTDTQSPLSHALTPPADLHSKYHRNLWEWVIQARGNNAISSSLDFSTRPSNAPKPIPRQPWHRNSNLFPARSSRRPVDVAACRDEDVSSLSLLLFHIIKITVQRYGIVPESDAEAAAAMLRTSDNEVDSPMQPGRPAVGAQVSHGRPTQTQALTSRPEGDVYEGVSCCGIFLGYRRRSNSLQP
ncbi:WD40-repeat-containing domain protein [Suillus clintonianus]|uniref:WD40-repeat-containing domain protein n=1 Tax=Suillus clintonianus TaxID=1904413 RepID=UPI001B86CC42|nr:WD40-repeat-containing domain protein [Suillus clintonianus]KAG2146344.1 WD40-repeat-containing domain protein [Suillus clintonianus]